MSAPREDRCRAMLEQLSRFVDGDLTAAQRREMAKHLGRCPCCRTLADSLQQTVDLCRKAGGARLPADVRTRAKARIETLLASGPAPRRRSAGTPST
jgi:anti-sigma factor RsiW